MKTTSSATADRRAFLKALGGSAMASPFLFPAQGRGAPPPSERIALAAIGVGGQGAYDTKAFLADPRVTVVAVCDTDRKRAAAAAGVVDAHYAEKTKAGTYSGCKVARSALDLVTWPDIDAVLIATPDHTHAQLTLAAFRAGKDVYCEKPLAYTVAEGRAVTDAALRLGRVLQTGTQRRSNGRIRHGCELVRNGVLGDLKTVRVGLPKGFAIRNGFEQTNYAPVPVPESFDYEAWLGPAPWAPYHPARCHFNFRWILDYGEGYISDWGAHYLDVAHWGMGADLTGPLTAEAEATFPSDGIYDAPTGFHIEYGYADGVALICSTRETLGMRFEGTGGWLHIEHPGKPLLSASDDTLLSVQPGAGAVRLYESDSQHRNFVDCVFSRRQTAAHGEVGHRSASVCHVGMIACRLGESLHWDPDAETFVDNARADRLLSRPARYPRAL